MINIDVTPSKRRFGRTPRKQWQWIITAANGAKFSEKDTYANPGDITYLWNKIINSTEPVQIRVHYQRGIETTILRPAP